MPYDQALAQRVRHALAARSDVIEKPMFGGVTFMVAGNMCCGVHRDDLILRLDGFTVASDLNSPHIRAWDFMKGPMRGMFAVNPAGSANPESLQHWVGLALKHALSLPPKTERTPKKVRSPARRGSR